MHNGMGSIGMRETNETSTSSSRKVFSLSSPELIQRKNLSYHFRIETFDYNHKWKRKLTVLNPSSDATNLNEIRDPMKLKH